MVSLKKYIFRHILIHLYQLPFTICLVPSKKIDKYNVKYSHICYFLHFGILSLSLFPSRGGLPSHHYHTIPSLPGGPPLRRPLFDPSPGGPTTW